MIGLGAAIFVLRIYEFPALQVSWHDNAYASIVWTMLGMHLTYVLAATLETLLVVIWVLLYGFDETRGFDVTLTSIYWYWMVGLWVPFYLAIYWLPRVL